MGAGGGTGQEEVRCASSRREFRCGRGLGAGVWERCGVRERCGVPDLDGAQFGQLPRSSDLSLLVLGGGAAKLLCVLPPPAGATPQLPLAEAVLGAEAVRGAAPPPGWYS